MPAIWLARADLENASAVETVASIFDDANSGTLNQAAIDQVIERAEQEVLAWLVPEYGPSPLSNGILAQLGADRFLKSAALEYAIVFMFDRHPEYVRSGSKDRADRIKRADERMVRVLDARQRAPTVTQPPANVGGAVVDNGSRIYIDSADGTSNAGDF